MIKYMHWDVVSPHDQSLLLKFHIQKYVRSLTFISNVDYVYSVSGAIKKLIQV